MEKTGGPEVLQLQEVASPGPPGAGQALVRIKVAGVNFFDVQQRRSNYPRPCRSRGAWKPLASSSGYAKA